MTAPHTPGPWYAEPSDYLRQPDLFNPEPEYWYISGPGADAHGFMPAADAYLLAAAPDLLEAAELLLSDVGAASSLPGAVKARAAIKKAKGQEPMQPGTLRHALRYLEAAKDYPDLEPKRAFAMAVRLIDKPCRAIGVARAALNRTDSLTSAISDLKKQLEGS